MTKNAHWQRESGWYLTGLGSGLGIFSAHTVIGLVILITGLVLVGSLNVKNKKGVREGSK